jgi:hypothetical protein
MSLDIHRSYPEQPLAWRPRLTGAPGDAVNNKLYGMEVALALCGFGDTPPPNLTTGLPASHHGYRATVVIGHCIRGDVIAMQTENCALERMGTVSVILDTQALAKQAGCGNRKSHLCTAQSSYLILTSTQKSPSQVFMRAASTLHSNILTTLAMMLSQP